MSIPFLDEVEKEGVEKRLTEPEKAK